MVKELNTTNTAGKTNHYFSEKQSSPLREEEISAYALKKAYHFISASGLFSREHLDIASRLLIEKSDLTGAKKILDLGCGWGPVAILIAKRLEVGGNLGPDVQILASDINERAVSYTKKNARKHKVSIITKKSNILKNWEDTDIDLILTNPPYAAGRKVCYAFIEESLEHLKVGGSLQLVARHQKGGKMLAKHMEEVFGNVEGIAIKSGFRIYKSVKRSKK